LPAPRLKSEMSLEEALSIRRSVRQYKKEPLTLNDVSQLLWAAQGQTTGWGGKTAPSAGAIYPLTVYLVVGEVIDLTPGVYRYLSNTHELEKISSKDVRKELAEAAWNQEYIQNAPINIVVAANYDKMIKRYGKRGVRYVDNEVGHVGQNVQLQGEALGLGSVIIGAFEDSAARSVLGIKEEVVYIIPVGKKVQ
ncbi:MAG: SagB/ThcOx family dehydrogenase, partial [candidate division WOR-3 bacterium]|nr:SagB/ThcOx family dehydrogenase [candidate division WOR-3 bacterium]